MDAPASLTVLGLPWATFALILALIVFLYLPVIGFMTRGSRFRRDEITGLLSDDAIKDYFTQFHPNLSLPSGTDYKALFRERYTKYLGWKSFIIPNIVLLGSIIISLCWVLGGAHLFPSMTGEQTGVPSVAVAAILGAYTWSLSDFVAKSLQRALRPADIWWVSFRLAVAVPLAYALVGFVKDDLAVPIAFLLGAFPMSTITTFARRLTRKNLDLGEGPEQSESELQKLQSIDSRIAERLVDENIQTILQLAYADPIDLCIRTNLSFNTVVDYVSQALLWIYLEDDTAKVRKFSLRGAQEAKSLWEDLYGADATDEDRKRAQTTVNAAATELGMSSPDVLLSTLNEVAADPYTVFLWEVWG